MTRAIEEVVKGPVRQARPRDWLVVAGDGRSGSFALTDKGGQLKKTILLMRRTAPFRLSRALLTFVALIASLVLLGSAPGSIATRGFRETRLVASTASVQAGRSEAQAASRNERPLPAAPTSRDAVRGWVSKAWKGPSFTAAHGAPSHDDTGRADREELDSFDEQPEEQESPEGANGWFEDACEWAVLQHDKSNDAFFASLLSRASRSSVDPTAIHLDLPTPPPRA